PKWSAVVDLGWYKFFNRDGAPHDPPDADPAFWKPSHVFCDTLREVEQANAFGIAVIAWPEVAAAAVNLLAVRIGAEDGRPPLRDQMLEHRALAASKDAGFAIHFD